jgi:hypothetical protein
MVAEIKGTKRGIELVSLKRVRIPIHRRTHTRQATAIAWRLIAAHHHECFVLDRSDFKTEKYLDGFCKGVTLTRMPDYFADHDEESRKESQD